MPLKPGLLLLAGAGGIVAVAGVKGWAIGKTFRDVVSGQSPAKNPTLTAQITPAQYGYASPASPGAGEAQGGIAGLAQAHIGFPYTWGGSPANGSGDCSSFVNWIVGTLAGRSIPGYPNGSYNGTSHGPTTLVWLAWLGTGITRVPQAQAQAGDLAIWQTHMGIITDNGQNMISDLNQQLGTQRTTIADGGPPGEILVCARLR